MLRRSLFLALFCAALMLPKRALAAASGPDTAASASDEVAPELGHADTSGVNTGALHVNAGVNFTTADFFRGIHQPENSPIFQPWVSLHLNVLNQGDVHLGPYVGATGSGAEKSHNGAPLTDYENDFFAGLNASVPHARLAVGYREYHSPNGSFASTSEVGARLDIDDSAFMKDENIPFSINPHVGLYREILDQNVAASIRSEPGKQNSYLEVGIRPQYQLNLNFMQQMPLTLALPITAGMSWDNYYSLTPAAHSNFFGFTNVGATASVPLPLPAAWGQWDLYGDFNWMHDFARGAQLANHGHKDFFFGGAGIAFHY
jgi:hypothetical protein